MRSALRRTVSTAAAVVMCLGGATLAAAAPVVFTPSPVAGWSTNGAVREVLIIGDTVYAGGDFTQVRGPGGTPVVDRARLAAWDIRTGALRTGFSADANGRVLSLATDGTKLFVGGDFTTIKGVSKTRLAAIDPATGNVVTAWAASATSNVYSLHVAGDRLFVAGSFGTLAGAARNRVGAVSTANGALDPNFNPNANATILDITASPDGSTVYLAGDFTTVGGLSRPYLAAVSSTSGVPTATTFQYPFAGATHSMTGIDVSDSGDQVFGSLGGGENRVQAWNARTGQVQWFYTVTGDTQAVRYYNGNVYFGFHEGALDDLTVRLLVADASTGRLENFRPTINSFWGVWSIDVSDLGLAVGGEFTSVNGIATQGVAIMPPGPADLIRPTAPGTPTVTGTTGSTVSLTWTPGIDETSVYGYRVLRNGVPIAYVTTTSFTDTGLPGDTDQTYRVQTVDGVGNLSDPSGAVTARTGLVVLPAGSTWRYLDNGTNQGTAWRASAFDDSTWQSSAAEFGYGDGDEATAIGYGPDANAKYITSYFRRTFTVTDPATIATVTVNLLRDDGAVVYLNGTEVARSNMPSGTISSSTLASTAVAGADETRWFPFSVNPALLVAGSNTLAVEVHQSAASSSDLSFNLSLEGTRRPTSPAPSGLTVTGTTDSSSSLSWTAPTGTGTTTEYRVYRDSVLVGSPVGTTFTDAGLLAARSYTYAVSAITDGVESARSTSVIATTTDTAVPSAPTNLVATSVTMTAVSLTWSPSTDNVGVVAYDVLRDGVVVGSPTTTAYTDATVVAGQSYAYTVRARDAAGNTSSLAGPVSVSTPAMLATQYADTFSAGNFTDGRWTTAAASLVAGSVSGYFARLTAVSGPAYLSWPATVLDQGRRSWSLRAYFRINSRASNQSVSLVDLRNAAGKSMYLFTNSKTGRCSVKLGGQTVTTAFRCDDGVWHLIELKGDFGSTTHTVDWRVDGVSQTSIALGGQAATSVRSLTVGDTGGNATNVTDWDNVGLTVATAAVPYLGSLTPFG